MVLGLKITCTCHQAKIAICCQMPVVALIAPKFCTGKNSNMLKSNWQHICSLTTPGIQALKISLNSHAEEKTKGGVFSKK